MLEHYDHFTLCWTNARQVQNRAHEATRVKSESKQGHIFAPLHVLPGVGAQSAITAGNDQ